MDTSISGFICSGATLTWAMVVGEELILQWKSKALEKTPAGITVGHIHCLIIIQGVAQND